jgi:hypothetical protein
MFVMLAPATLWPVIIFGLGLLTSTTSDVASPVLLQFNVARESEVKK